MWLVILTMVFCFGMTVLGLGWTLVHAVQMHWQNVGGSLIASLLTAIAGGACFGFWRLSKAAEGNTAALFQWLLAYKDELEEGRTLIYDGNEVTIETKLTQFNACISIGILTLQIPSAYMFSNSGMARLIGFLYTFVSFFFGWWGIPAGPIFTIKSLLQNLFGGSKKTVGELIPIVEQQLRQSAEREANIEATRERMRDDHNKMLEAVFAQGGQTLPCWVVMAHNELFEEDEVSSQFAQVVFLWNSGLSGMRLFRELERISEELSSYEAPLDASKDEIAIAKLIKSQVKNEKALRVPNSVSRGLPAYTISAYIERKKLPENCLKRPFVYCTIALGDKDACKMEDYPANHLVFNSDERLGEIRPPQLPTTLNTNPEFLSAVREARAEFPDCLSMLSKSQVEAERMIRLLESGNIAEAFGSASEITMYTYVINVYFANSPYGGGPENVWLHEPIKILNDNMLTGTLPDGETVGFTGDYVMDWLVMRPDLGIKGGYTFNVLRQQMPQDKRELLVDAWSVESLMQPSKV